ncbi:unnamed protein product [Vitrella brassicaformis CCMP3155]|uniref:Uncharacterized protein n=2 Tax=Vitrella brassicaformis TaxID=1169539 RepID=A0A0G4ETZ7_VITBC|nr:unnamed protein product [Vitrella brassicaformis CCMP3155]|eukprot:CEM01860.1 unnamed protein product [Vitrella brassicaformis CCMP3155]
MTKRARTAANASAASSAASHTQSRFPDVLGEAGIVLADFLSPADLYALRRTCPAGRHQPGDVYFIHRINRCIADKQIGGLLTFDANYQPGDGEDMPRVAYLMQLLYVLDEGGQWGLWMGPLRIARHGRLVQSLPISVRPADVRRVGSKAVFDGRADSLKQYSLFGHLMGQDGVVALRQIDGIEQLGETVVTVYTQETLPADHEFATSFDPTDPIVRVNNEVDYASFRQLAILRFPCEEQLMCHRTDLTGDSSRAALANRLLTQAAIPWGRQTRMVSIDDHRRRSGSIYLCGEGPNDSFAARVHMTRQPTFWTTVLYTTEAPRPQKEGSLRFPRTAKLTATCLGRNDKERLFDHLRYEQLSFRICRKSTNAVAPKAKAKAKAKPKAAP